MLDSQEKHLSIAIRTALLSTLSMCASTVMAQAESDVEEVVVTGSYIRNSAFTQNSPVDNISQEDLFESGNPSIGEYIRDLTYTQNTDVVGNPFGGTGGTGASFNLRGLGENSTLTMIDGMRLLEPRLVRNLPQIAIDRMELVLDGGSALYGSDAVAGVVNIIPIKEFDGFRTMLYYQGADHGGTEDINASLLWGKSFNNGVSYVGAFEFKRKTELMMFERPREMQVSATTAPSGNPGSFVEVVGADPGINIRGNHNGTLLYNNVLTDPSCETFNDGYPSQGSGANAIPSGHELPGGQCSWQWTLHHSYMPERDDYNLYQSLTVDANDWLRLSGDLRLNYTARPGRQLAIRSYGTNDRSVALIRADHPANPYGVDVAPYSWHVFADAFSVRPAVLDDHNNRHNNWRDWLYAARVKAEYDIVGSWTGVTTYGQQEQGQMYDFQTISTERLQLALNGMGGPNGDEWFNPFGSADPRSPYYDESTANSQQLTDWLWYINNGYRPLKYTLEVFETVASGELFELPFGTVQMAIGYQWREKVQNTYAEPARAQIQGFDYVRAPMNAAPPFDETYNSEVHATFLEIQAPLWETVDAQFAIRNEVFDTFGLTATTPKLSIRWEALPTLALRASWGESFLAPTPYDARPFIPDQSCFETYTGKDLITGTDLAGGVQCSSGNQNLKPETSELVNVGFSWEPNGVLSGFSLSVDYQEIEYQDRIRSLSAQDTVQFQFDQMLAATGQTAANYDPTPGSASRVKADAWLATLPAAGPSGNKVSRFFTGEVEKVYLQPANISSVWIDGLDVNASYTFNTRTWGTFSARAQATHYLTFDYEDLTGGKKDGLGQQNALTGIVPPLPRTKANVIFSWFRNNQSASFSTSYWSDMKYDGYVIDYYGDIRPGGPLQRPDTIRAEHISNIRYAIQLDEIYGQQFNVSVGINNLFDKQPQRLPTFGGFESRLTTPWGRQFWISMDWTPTL
ncbi:MAG: TonB-dependent receptor [Gammaproteobacteria bacterium]|nr:TonB-dependent receptor [Pseudomonadales bacterium]MCP5346148.1 TonB-dependent receptor [Pseudomonadales bacterium]